MEIKQKKRSEIDNSFKWHLNDMFPTDETWRVAHDKAAGMADAFKRHRGVFTKNADALLSCLTDNDELNRLTEAVYVYARMKQDEDSADTVYQGLADKAESLAVKVSAATAFIEPELLALSEAEITGLVAQNSGLKLYRHYFDDLIRVREHVLSPEMEELLSNAEEIGGAAQNIFSMLNNADMKFGNITDENGNTVQLTHGKYISMLESKNRKVREEAYTMLYDTYTKQKNTIASTFSASVKKDVFFTRARKFDATDVPASLAAALYGNNIPTSVYTNLISAVSESLPEMHRYVALRKKALGVSELRFYDLYVPIVPEADTHISYDEAKATVLKSLAPMGAEYVSVVKDGFDKGWIDVYENEGKRSGAYSWGAYGFHPYVLLNYDEKLDDMFTLAHEMGHAMHSYYTWGNQKFIYGDYSIFLAEVASTVNEALLMDHLLKTKKDEATQKYLLNHYLENFRGTVFRQTMFAEFELITHKMAEDGEPLTVEALCGVYRELNKKYYGPDIVIDERIVYEWMRIPHFYNAFYVYQYATGFSAAVTLSEKILNAGGAGSYMEFLKGGSSDYPINILKKAGVDMTSEQPVKSALNVFKGLLDKMEAL